MRGAAFLGVLRFEIVYNLRRISTWAYYFVFFAVAVLLIQLAGGAWPNVQVALSGSGGNVHVNSPYVLAGLTGVLSLFGVIVTAALLGSAVFKDFDTGIHPLFFTTPVSRISYLGGRLLGALVVNAIVFSSIPVGFMFGSAMPNLDANLFGPFQPMAFLHPYLVLVLPNLVFTGTLFFCLAALARRMLPNYVGGVVLLIAYSMSGQYLSELENQRLAALLDPFGLAGLEVLTRYWTPVERNTRLLPVEGDFLLNRALLVGLALLLFTVTLFRFAFAHHAPERRRRRAGATAPEEPVQRDRPRGYSLPEASRPLGARAHATQYLSVVRRSFFAIVANRYFFAIVGAGVLFMVLMAGEVGKLYGTTTWPVTYAVLDVLGGTFALFTLIIITFYAGELVWAERDARLHQVHDSTPVRGWIPLFGKWTALALMLVVLQTSVMITGIVTQAVRGYFNFEVGLYLRTLFGVELISLLLLSAFVVLIHVLVNHKYAGHLIVVMLLVFTTFMNQIGLEHTLYRYNSGSTGLYSDMNGFGPFLEPFFWLKGYWAAWALLFAVVSNLFWVRGEEVSARWRVHLARLRFTRPALAATAVAGLLILTLGGFIFYNTNVLNEYDTRRAAEVRWAEYEREYKRFEGIPQPRVAAVTLLAEIYPERRDLTVSGRYHLVNRTESAIDSLHVVLSAEAQIRRMELSSPADRVHSSDEHGYHIYRLGDPLQPGDSLILEFELAFLTRGFPNRVESLAVVENGTFFHSTYLPSLGYEPRLELTEDDTRRRRGLEPRAPMPHPDDPVARRNNYVSRDADWIDFDVTVGTSADQIALAPGYLQREWTENGRRYFHYRMDAPILNFYSFLSARYAVRRDAWNGVAIEIYYHPGHEYNLDRMIESVRRSLEYYTTEFGPYQHTQVRILEFPRYQSFAQAFPNTIPYSEAIGFIARVESEDDIDYPFYVTAHEVAHQWWAHQVIGGDARGSTLMSETLSQYSALMVMEREYGKEQIRRFLQYELDRYLTGRAFERRKELPLLYNEGQQYVHYNKGSLVMYALRDYIGEEALNAALRAYLEANRFQQPPYTSSLELYGYLQAATPDSLQYVLEDMFEHITLYDNRVREVASTHLSDGSYRVTLDIEARKVRADSLGFEIEVPMNDLIDIGVFAAREGGQRGEGRPLYLEKHRVTSGPQRIEVIVSEEPARAGIDPYSKLIDRVVRDNMATVRRE